MEVEDIFGNSLGAPVAAPATSKKWMQPKIRFDLRQEIYDANSRLVAVHEKFPVDLGHKQI
jgi:hypothetical protein